MAAQILIIYDRPEKEQALKKILHQKDYRIQSAGSGARGIDMAEQEPPDLIFLAPESRDLDGFEACRRLRQRDATAETPVLFFSNKRDAAFKMRAFRAGVTDYIVEPFEENEILVRVQSHLGRILPAREMEGQIEYLSTINATKDRLLRLYSQVNRLLSQVLTNHGHKAMMQIAMERAAQLTGSPLAAVSVFDRTANTMRYEYFWGFTPPMPSFIRRLDATTADELFERRAPIAINDYQQSGTISLFKDRNVRCFMGAPLGSDGELIGLLSVFRTAEEQYGEEEEEQLWVLAPVLSATVYKARYEQKVANLVTRDPLTNLFNRSFGMEALQKEIQRCQTRQLPISAYLMEVDRLREVNEAHGYRGGDALLKAIGEVVQSRLEKGMHAARFGEEFLVILPGKKSSEAEAHARDVLKAVRELRVGQGITSTVSVGCSTHFAGEEAQKLYSRCDSCLAIAKREGGDRLTTSG